MRRLPDDVKRRIIEHLACFQTNAEVVRLIAEEFDVTLTPRHVRAYDPTSPQFVGAPRWVEYHRLVRQRFEREIGQIAIAHQFYRLLMLDKLIDRTAEQGNVRLAAKLLEQAAKEVGNWYVR